MKTALLVANPTAGAWRAPDFAARLASELQAHGFSTETIPTTATADDSLPQRLAGADVAVALGGDGTLNRVADAIVRIEDPQRRPRLAFLACGTGNAATRAFRLPRTPESVARLIADGSTRTIDVGVVSRDGMRVATFLLWAGIGLDATLIESVAQNRANCRGTRVTLEYVWQGLRMMFAYRFPTIHLQSPEAPPGPFGAVMIANVGQMAIGAVTAHANPSDGRLNVIATKPRSRALWIASAIMTTINLYDRCPRVSRTLATRLHAESASYVPVHVDGEPIGALPVDIEILPSALNLCAPGL